MRYYCKKHKCVEPIRALKDEWHFDRDEPEIRRETHNVCPLCLIDGDVSFVYPEELTLGAFLKLEGGADGTTKEELKEYKKDLLRKISYENGINEDDFLSVKELFKPFGSAGIVDPLNLHETLAVKVQVANPLVEGLT